MGPLTRGWIVTIAVAAVAVGAVLLLARGNEPAGGVPPQAPVTVRASLDRETVEFGDVVTAAVTVFVDRDAVRSSDVRLRENLAPLTQLGRTRVTLTTRGRLLTINYTARASCLDQRCIGKASTKRIVLPTVVVDVSRHGTSKASWPPLGVRARVSQADVVRPHPPLRSDATPPPVSYRFEPSRLALVLELAAAVLAVAGVLLAGATAMGLIRRRRRVRRLTELERALALVREAEQRPPPDRRRAVGLLARMLGSRDARLAGAADDLAWSAPPPTPASLSQLVTQVEREVNGN